MVRTCSSVSGAKEELCLCSVLISDLAPLPSSVSSPVELLISQTLCWVHDDLDKVDFSSYMLKVCGREEVLQR